VKTAIGQD